MELSDQELASMLQRAQKLAVSPQRGFSLSGCVTWILAGIMFVVFIAALLPKIAETYPVPVLSQLFVTPQTAFSTPQEAPGAMQEQQAQPSPFPRYTPFYGAPAAEAAPVFSGELPGATAEPAPTSANFWTPEEQTQVAVTATAFIEVIPTAPPEFVSYTQEKCRDPEIVAQSALLQAWCGK